MKLVYWKRGEFIYCINLDRVQSIRIGPGIGREHVIAFVLDSEKCTYYVPKPLTGEQIKILLTLLQSSFVLNLDEAIKAILKEEEKDEQRKGERHH
ncbi:hypothetical protein J7J18_02605 [bacterium]|nr:hypothetical protein [bacterium]